MNVSRSALLNYSAQQMYSIVEEIELYPEFLPWCDSIEVLDTQDNQVTAKMNIAYGGLKFGFTTRNLNNPVESIDLELVEGPFTRLTGHWKFIELSETACKTSIDMVFDFDSSLAKSVIAKVFQKIVSKQLDAFQKRAQQIYPNPGEHRAID